MRNVLLFLVWVGVLELITDEEFDRQTNLFCEWQERNESELTDTWLAYCINIDMISYSTYCLLFYKGKLPYVRKSTYYKSLK